MQDYLEKYKNLIDVESLKNIREASLKNAWAPECKIDNLVASEPLNTGNVQAILNNSFGMLGINSALIIKKYID